MGHREDPPLAENGAATEMTVAFLNAHLPWKLTHLSLLPAYDPGVSSLAIIQGPHTTFCRNGKQIFSQPLAGQAGFRMGGDVPGYILRPGHQGFGCYDREEPLALGVG